MASPFPGMDPYLERHWRDVHSRLVPYSSDALNAVLPPDLFSRVEERVAIEPEDELARLVVPDVRVSEAEPGPSGQHPAAAASAVAEPVVLFAQIEPLTERYVTVIDAHTGRLVTVLEFISPTNKRPGEGLRDYAGKRRELLNAGVNVVEVDLVRQGNWAALLLPHVAHPRHHTAYRVTTRRLERPGQVDLFPIGLRSRLPIIPIPLRPADADVTLDLQAMLDQVYRNARYDHTNYRQPCDPPLEGEDAAWADKVLREAGRR